jgi:hypothetical protein
MLESRASVTLVSTEYEMKKQTVSSIRTVETDIQKYSLSSDTEVLAVTQKVARGNM